MKRNKHSLSHYKLVTGDMGQLIPVATFEVLPGDSVQQATSLLLRCSPLVAPVMHPVSVRVHHWFVPHRLVWDGWEDFITGGADGLGGDAGSFPTLTTGPQGIGVGSIGDYMGIPTGVPNLEVSVLPTRAYGLIWNEFYRDQDLQDPLAPPEAGQDAGFSNPPLPVAWEKDYFTSSRPWPQKGPDVSLPLGVEAPVVSNTNYVNVRFGNDTADRSLVSSSIDDSLKITPPVGQSDPMYWGGETGLKADLTQASAVNVNDVRLAFALQRYQEARARYGSRYTEYLRYLGVRSSDARLQRPEYLGGGKQTISFSEVLKTGGGEDVDTDPIGTMKGHGIAAMRSRRYRRFFEEHGTVLSLLSVRPRTMYTEGLHRMWSRRTKEDFWQKELEQIGQQEVYRREVYAQANAAGAGGDAVFGYQDRYAEYKHLPSTVHGEFRNLMNYWHLGRSFASAPALNRSFIECDPSKRIFAEQTQHSLWVMVNNSIQARRLVSRSNASRIL